MLEVVEGQTSLPVPTPNVLPEMTAYWEALRGGVFLLPRCLRCANVIWSPRPYCPFCGSLEVEWFPASGEATVYSYTVNRRGKGFNRKYEEVGPYVIAYVELAEGPRILTNIVDCDPADVAIGAAVRAVVHRSGDDVILRFRLADTGS